MSLRVLLVDDLEMNLTIMTKQLKAFGLASPEWRMALRR